MIETRLGLNMFLKVLQKICLAFYLGLKRVWESAGDSKDRAYA